MPLKIGDKSFRISAQGLRPQRNGEPTPPPQDSAQFPFGSSEHGVHDITSTGGTSLSLTNDQMTHLSHVQEMYRGDDSESQGDFSFQDALQGPDLASSSSACLRLPPPSWPTFRASSSDVATLLPAPKTTFPKRKRISSNSPPRKFVFAGRKTKEKQD